MSALHRSSFLLLLACLAAALARPLPAGAEPLATRAEDPRLQRKVSARVTDQPLTTWLERLARVCGVDVTTAPEYEDRWIAVRARDLQLGELLDAVAALYGDRWVVRGEKEHSSYRLKASEARLTKQRLL